MVFFAALTVAPFLRSSGSMLGLDVASESALAAGLVMGIMIIPFVSSLSDDVINAVPQSLRDAGYGLGSTKNETVLKIVLPACLARCSSEYNFSCFTSSRRNYDCCHGCRISCQPYC